jgi:hypothetical protein
MSSASRYERHYDVQLLDDLHNYFPAILYDPLRFNTVRELLQYVQDQMRAHFDLFSAGVTGFRSRAGRQPLAQPPPRPRQATSSTISTPPIRTPPPSVGSSAASAAPSPAPRPVGLADVVESLLGLAAAGGQPDEIGGGSATGINVTATPPSLLDLLSVNSPYTWSSHPLFSPTIYTTVRATLSPAAAAAARTNDSPFIQPTLQQIQSGSIIGLIDRQDQVCAICQEDLPIGSHVRTLRACNHPFHIGCIDTWLLRDVHCPVCRHDIREPATTTGRGAGETETDTEETAAISEIEIDENSGEETAP